MLRRRALAMRLGYNAPQKSHIARINAQDAERSGRRGRLLFPPPLELATMSSRTVPIRPRTSSRTADAILAEDPQNAWLLFGDNASFPAGDGEGSDEAMLWTSSKRTIAGDLLFIYYIAPRKAIHFVARALSDAFFSSDTEIYAETTVNRHQWWVEISEPIEVPPIRNSRVQQLAGRVQLRGRSGIYLRPGQASALIADIFQHHSEPAHLRSTLKVPTGLAELSRPGEMDLEKWAQTATGVLRLEADVEEYVVEPLLRLALGTRPGATWTRQRPIPKASATGKTGYADYAVLRDGEVRSVIEVKQAIRTTGDEYEGPDLDQLRRYADALQVPGALMDANRILLINPGPTATLTSIERRTATTSDLPRIAQHLDPSSRP